MKRGLWARRDGTRWDGLAQAHRLLTPTTTESLASGYTRGNDTEGITDRVVTTFADARWSYFNVTPVVGDHIGSTHVSANGLYPSEPDSELAADPLAVGWELRVGGSVSPPYYDYDRLVEWDLEYLDDSDWFAQYLAWCSTHTDPWISGTVSVDITTLSSSDATYTGQAGTFGGAAAVDHVTGVYGGPAGLLPSPATYASGTPVTALGTYSRPVPAARTVGPFTDVVVTALTSVPDPAGLTPAGRSVVVGGTWGSWVEGLHTEYRLLLAGMLSAVRRFPRGDGLVFSPHRHFTTSGSTQQGGSRIGWR